VNVGCGQIMLKNSHAAVEATFAGSMIPSVGPLTTEIGPEPGARCRAGSSRLLMGPLVLASAWRLACA